MVVPTTFVLVHGAFHGGWCWKRVARVLRGSGHEVYTPTLTGLGERKHLRNRDVGLDTHVEDIVNLLDFEDLTDVTLVGHSYGGAVISGVASRSRERLAHLVYLDGNIPANGQSVFDTYHPDLVKLLRELASAQGDGWLIPPASLTGLMGVTGEEDQAWLERNLTPQPLLTLTQPAICPCLPSGYPPRTYVYCTNGPTAPYFRPYAEQAKAEGWHYRELPTGHDAMITMPGQVAELLVEASSRPENATGSGIS